MSEDFDSQIESCIKQGVTKFRDIVNAMSDALGKKPNEIDRKIDGALQRLRKSKRIVYQPQEQSWAAREA